jgi:hypothetical protein
MSVESKSYWCRKFIDVQLGSEADAAAKELAEMFLQQYNSSHGPLYRGDFRSGTNLLLINKFIHDQLPTEYDIDGKTWNLQDVYDTGLHYKRMWTSCPVVEATLDLYPTVLSIMHRYEL